MTTNKKSADPESTRVVIVLAGPDGAADMDCIVRHYGPAVTDVRFPAAWRAICEDVGLDAFDVESENQISSLAESAFARMQRACA